MLLEREHTIAEFNDLMGTLHKNGKVLLLSGEAGIGKTSLIEHLYNSVEGDVKMFWGGCDPLITPQPYAPIYDIAAQLSPNLLALLESGAVQAKVFSAFYKAIEALTVPTLIIIEDLHWADNATIDLLKFFVRRISLVPCLLCLTYRDDEVNAKHPFATVLQLIPSAHAKRIELKPLSIDAVGQLAKESKHNPQHLHEITSGNPFFVTELLATNNTSEKDVPASIVEAIATRIASLTPIEKSFVQTISLIPYGIPVHLLEFLFPEHCEMYVADCIARKLLVCDSKGDLRFRHELARLATLTSLPLYQQKIAHRKILDALEALGITGDLAWLVHHAQGAFDAKRVLHYAPLAGSKAADFGAHKEAASFYEKALSYAAEADTEIAASLYENWAYEVGLTTHMKQSVIDARKHAIALYKALGRQEKVGENLRWLSRLYWYQGDAERAEYFVNEAIKLFESLPSSSELAMAYSLRSQLEMLNDHTESAVMWGNKALAVEKLNPNPAVKVHALNNIGTALVMNGQTQGEALLEQSMDLAQQLGLHEDVARVYTNYSDYCVRYKQLAKAEALISAGIQFDVSHDLDSWTYYLVGIQAQLRLEQGRLSDAEAIASGVQELENQTLLMKLPSLSVLAAVRSRMGQQNASALLEQALQNAIATNENQYIVPVRLSLIEHAWLIGDSPSSAAHFDWLFSVSASSLNIWQRGELLTWQKRVGYETTVACSGAIAKPYQLELAGDYENAYRCWQDLGIPFNAILALLHAPKTISDALFDELLTIVDSIQANALLTWLRVNAKQHDYLARLPKQTRGPYSNTKKHPAGLTSKEQLVLSYMLEGASNLEIAQAMSRSQRTVENHVSSILSKLEVENRVEAMLRVQNEPWLAAKSVT